MILGVYAVFDAVASIFSKPYFLGNDNLAMRAFGDAVADESTGISKHIADFKLYKVSEFDDNSGMFIRHDPVFLCNATDFMALVKTKNGGIENGKNSSESVSL